MIALRLDRADHFRLKRDGVAVGRFRPAGINCSDIHMVAGIPATGTEHLFKRRDIARPVSGRVGIGDIRGNLHLPRRRMLGAGLGEPQNFQIIEHRGFSLDLTTPRLNPDSFRNRK